MKITNGVFFEKKKYTKQTWFVIFMFLINLHYHLMQKQDSEEDSKKVKVITSLLL